MATRIIIPTYNERENILSLIAELLAAAPNGTRILVVDDQSPDGTAELVREFAAKEPRVALMTRSGPRGFRAAYQDALARVLADGTDEFVITIDADFSHNPRYIPALIRAAEGADLVVGSRYVRGGRIENWSIGRRLLSWGGNWYVRTITGLPLADCTSGFSCMRTEFLRRVPFADVRANGYAWWFTLRMMFWRRGARMAEVPITFTERRLGTSKISRSIISEGLVEPWRIRLLPEGSNASLARWFLAPARWKSPLPWILLVAVLLRLPAIGYGFPLFLVNDEPAFIYGALKMLEERTLIPALHAESFRAVLNYPPLLSYFYLLVIAPALAVHFVLAGFPQLAAWRDMLALDPTFLWWAGRLANLGLSIILIALVARMTQAVSGSRRAGWFAAAFLALSFYHIQLSHVVRHWMPAALLLYLAWYASFGIGTSDRWRPYILTGVFAGLATAVNTSAAIALIPGLFAHYLFGCESWRTRIRSVRPLAMVGIAVLMVGMTILLYPYGFTRGEGGETVGGDLGRRFGILAGKGMGEWLAFLGGYAGLLLRYELPLLAAAVVGAAILWRRKASFVIPAVVVAVAYISFLYAFFNAIPRALVFIVPVLAILAGAGLDALLQLVSTRVFVMRRGITAMSLLAVFGFPLVLALRYDMLAIRTETRLMARDWIAEYISAGEKIVGDTPYLRLINTPDGIRALEAADAAGVRAADRALLRHSSDAYPSPAYEFLNLHFIARGKPERDARDAAFFRERGYRYLVVEYNYRDQSDLEPETRSLISELKLVQRFSPYPAGAEFDQAIELSGEIAGVPIRELWRMERFGSIVDIYAL
ncbi:glycosyltransferase [Candidatus Parcubacteria bacterium]|nr:MAG: glycosyltransferase [Candidatus Parcubacteria bacterium]